MLRARIMPLELGFLLISNFKLDIKTAKKLGLL